MKNNILFLLDGGTEKDLIKKLNLNVDEYNIEVLNSNEILKNSMLNTLIKYTKYRLSNSCKGDTIDILFNKLEYSVIKDYPMIIIQFMEKDVPTIVKLNNLYSVQNWFGLVGEIIY